MVLAVNVAPSGGVEEHTCQLRSLTSARPLPVRSVELLNHTASWVNDWIASCAPSRSLPIRFGMVHDGSAYAGGLSATAVPIIAATNTKLLMRLTWFEVAA